MTSVQFPEMKPYELPNIHRVFVNSANRLSGTYNDFFVHINMSSFPDEKNLNYIKLLSVSPFVSSTAKDYYVASRSFTQQYSYNTNTNMENFVIGVVPIAHTSGSNYIQACSQTDNTKVYCSGLATIVKGGMLNIRLENADGTLNSDITSNVSLVFELS